MRIYCVMRNKAKGDMDTEKTPEIIFNEAILLTVRGLRISENPAVAELAAREEQQLVKKIKTLRRGGLEKIAA